MSQDWDNVHEGGWHHTMTALIDDWNIILLETLKNPWRMLDIFLHKSFAYYHKYILRYFMWLLQKLRYQLRHSFLRQELLQHKNIFVLIVHSDGEDYRILFEKSFYQKKIKSVFSTMTTEFYCLCLEQWNSIIWQVRFS